MQGNIGDLVEGLNRLRTSALIQIIGFIINGIGLIGMIGTLGFTWIMDPYRPRIMDINRISGLLPVIFLFLFLILISFILLISAFYYLYTATGYLKEYDEGRLGIGRTGMILVAVGAVLMPLLLIIGLVSISAILIIIGMIMFSVMLMRLGDMENISTNIYTAGILYIIGTILAIIPYLNIVAVILNLIAAILIYMGAGESIYRIA
jgi:MFS family permease